MYLAREINAKIREGKTVTAILLEHPRRVRVVKARSEIGQSLQVMSPDNPTPRFYKIVESSVEVSEPCERGE